MRRALYTALLTLALLSVSAPLALAQNGQDGGEGLYGETSDKVITNAGFFLIAFFPLFILAMSLLQWRLDKRKERRKAADKARRARADLRGGWWLIAYERTGAAALVTIDRPQRRNAIDGEAAAGLLDAFERF